MAMADAGPARAESWLERALAVRLRVDAEVLAYGVVMLAAVLTRFLDLGTRVMSHDEVSHVYYSWNLLRGLGFQHNPLMHGPLQFHLLALAYFLFGASDASARFWAALCGVGAVAMMWLFRRWLGRTGALVAAALMLISPYMLYYSRYARNEAFVVVEVLAGVWAVLRYFETRQARWLYLLAASAALHFATKETSYFAVAQMLLFVGVLFVIEALRAPWRQTSHKVGFLGGLTLAAGGSGLALFFLLRQIVATTRELTGRVPTAAEAGATAMYATLVGLGALLAAAGAILIASSLMASFGRRLRTDFPSLDVLVVLGTLTLTQLPALALPAATISSYGQSADAAALVEPAAIARLWVALPVVFLAALAVGLAWDWRRWPVAAGVFTAIYVPLYTTLFTHGMGLATGSIGSLAYWLGQQGVERGSQPWYYFMLLQIPIYEFLPALGSLAVLVYALRRRLPRAGEAGAPGGARFPAIAFIGFWAVTSLLAFTAAGEKMPWLTVHITLPMILLSGWIFGRFLDGFDWGLLRQARTWLTFGLAALAIFSLGRALGYLLGTQPPFQGAGLEQLWATTGFLAAAGFGILALAGLARAGLPAQPGRVAGVLALGILAALTLRAALRAAFVNYDQATEFLVYAHSATGPKTVLAQLDDLSRRTTDGLAMEVAYDNETSYPFMWYLRDYSNTRPFGATPSRDLLNYPAVIVGDANWSRVEPLLANRYHSFEYIRMWWPMQDYWDLTWERILTALTSAEYREGLWQIWLNRDYRAYSEASGADLSLERWQPAARMRLYLRRDLTAQVWDYGVLPAALEEQPFADPYAGAMTELAADIVVDRLEDGAPAFSRPRALAIGRDGGVYVADTGNHRIVRLGPDGAWRGAFGAFSGNEGPAEPGTFNEPWGVAVAPDGTVYVADTWNHRVQRFSADGRYLGGFGYFGQAEAPEAFWGPRGLAVDSAGRLFVADTGNKRVVVFDRSGAFVGSFGGAGYEPGRLDEPVGVAVAPDGAIYVADTWNLRVQVFEETEPGVFAHVREWPIEGWYGQSLDNKPYLAIGPQARLCASDPEGYRVLCFDGQGQFLIGWGSFGAESTQFGLPSGVAFDAQGGLWVSDAGGHRLMHYTPQWP